MGLIAYFTSSCKVRCADQAAVPAGMARKNEVITFSRDANINTAGSTPNGELQTALLIDFTKQKRKL